MIPRINNLIEQLTQLRTEFESGIANGKTYSEVKTVYLQMKELQKLLQQQREASQGSTAAN